MNEIKKGVCVDTKGLTGLQKEAVIKRFEDAGFIKSEFQDYKERYVFAGFSSEKVFSSPTTGGNLTEIPFSEFMFIGRMAKEEHCFYDWGKIYWSEHDGFAPKEFLVCSRERPIKKSDWYEKGELPPVGEVVEYSLIRNAWSRAEVLFKNSHLVLICVNGDPTESRTFCVDDENLKFRPIQSERDKLIEEAKSTIKAHHWGEGQIIEALIDAGWRPKDE